MPSNPTRRFSRTELVRLLVLNEICDDYENVDQIILPHLAQNTAKCGLTIERLEIVQALLAAQIPPDIRFAIEQLSPRMDALAPMPQAKLPAPSCDSPVPSATK